MRIGNITSFAMINSGPFTYVETNGRQTIVRFDPSLGGELVFPDQLDGKSVLALFLIMQRGRHRTTITKAKIPSSVEQIHYGSFRELRTLEQVEFAPGSRLWMIGPEAFRASGITSFTVPKSVTEINPCAFLQCGRLSTVNFEAGSGLKIIGEFAFQDTAIKSIRIPKSVKTIGACCFQNCRALSEVVIENDSNLKRIGYGAFINCSLTKFHVPSKVAVLDEACFAKCEALKEVTFDPASCLREIQQFCFHESGLVKIRIPSSVTEIRTKCFLACKGLQEVTFEGCNLRRFEESVFKESGLREITIPKAIENIESKCFQDCVSLSSVKFEAGSALKNLGNHVFSNSGIKTIKLPQYLVVIPKKCFEKCKSLGEISFENGRNLTTIQEYAFANSGLKSFYFPCNVQCIGRKCFNECASLSQVTFEDGAHLVSIGSSAFAGSGIKSIDLGRNPDALKTVLFDSETGLSPSGVQLSGRPSETEGSLVSSLTRSQNKYEWLFDINEYEQKRLLGSGGFGSVHLYEHKRDKTQVAIKLSPAYNEKDQDCFESEFDTLMKLVHPCVIDIRGCMLPNPKNGNNYAISMEYMPCGSLKDVLDQKPDWLNDTAKAIIVYGIARGMAYVHENKIIHRDLKPGNVLIDEQHRPRICDFGSSRTTSLDTTMTQNPACTPLYAAPEFGSSDYDQSVDVYSFGVMLWEIVAGKKPCIVGYISNGLREGIPKHASEFTSELIATSWDQAPGQRPSFANICAGLEENIDLVFPAVDKNKFRQYMEWINSN